MRFAEGLRGLVCYIGLGLRLGLSLRRAILALQHLVLRVWLLGARGPHGHLLVWRSRLLGALSAAGRSLGALRWPLLALSPPPPGQSWRFEARWWPPPCRVTSFPHLREDRLRRLWFFLSFRPRQKTLDLLGSDRVSALALHRRSLDLAAGLYLDIEGAAPDLLRAGGLRLTRSHLRLALQLHQGGGVLPGVQVGGGMWLLTPRAGDLHLCAVAPAVGRLSAAGPGGRTGDEVRGLVAGLLTSDGFVQEHDLGVSHESERDVDAPFLAARKRAILLRKGPIEPQLLAQLGQRNGSPVERGEQA